MSKKACAGMSSAGVVRSSLTAVKKECDGYRRYGNTDASLTDAVVRSGGLVLPEKDGILFFDPAW